MKSGSSIGQQAKWSPLEALEQAQAALPDAAFASQYKIEAAVIKRIGGVIKAARAGDDSAVLDTLVEARKALTKAWPNGVPSELSEGIDAVVAVGLREREKGLGKILPVESHPGKVHAYASGSGALSFVVRDDVGNPVAGRRPTSAECVGWIKDKMAAGQGVWAGSEWVIVNQGPLDRENHAMFEAVQKVERLAADKLLFQGREYTYVPSKDNGMTPLVFTYEVSGRELQAEGSGNLGALGYFLRNEKLLADPDRVVWDSERERVGAEKTTLASGVAIVSSGQFAGKMARLEDGYVVQDTGRGKEVAHDAQDWDDKPTAGESFEVKYANGRALVDIKGRGKNEVER